VKFKSVAELLLSSVGARIYLPEEGQLYFQIRIQVGILKYYSCKSSEICFPEHCASFTCSNLS